MNDNIGNLNTSMKTDVHTRNMTNSNLRSYAESTLTSITSLRQLVVEFGDQSLDSFNETLRNSLALSNTARDILSATTEMASDVRNVKQSVVDADSNQGAGEICLNDALQQSTTAIQELSTAVRSLNIDTQRSNEGHVRLGFLINQTLSSQEDIYFLVQELDDKVVRSLTGRNELVQTTTTHTPDFITNSKNFV